MNEPIHSKQSAGKSRNKQYAATAFEEKLIQDMSIVILILAASNNAAACPLGNRTLL